MKGITLLILLGLALSSNYNPDNAIKYARTYCKNYNSKYYNYAKDGGDCANFVSQCLKAGGLNLDDCAGWVDYYGCLPRVSDLQSCLKAKGWHSSNTMPRGFRGGYPIFLQDGSHAMIATGVSGSTVIFCGHTNDRCDYTISSGITYFYP